MSKPRLFVENLNLQNNRLELTGNAHHYLARVMRMKPGDELAVFDGHSPSLNAKIIALSKQSSQIEIQGEERPLLIPPPLTLAFAPIKKARTDFIVEKAAELGARNIQPILTEFTNSERVRIDRLQRHAIEAIEQCGGNFVPQLHEPLPLEKFLITAPSRALIFCDESAENGSGQKALKEMKAADWAILIGPEGGFSEAERQMILRHKALAISLGPRILRADTAAIAAITLWQNLHGDWHQKPNSHPQTTAK